MSFASLHEQKNYLVCHKKNSILYKDSKIDIFLLEVDACLRGALTKFSSPKDSIIYITIEIRRQSWSQVLLNYLP